MARSHRRASTSTRHTTLIVAVSLALGRAVAQTPSPSLFDADLLSKVSSLAATTATPDEWPEYTGTNGQWALQPETDWTSGFFPSSLFYLYSRTLLCPEDTAGADWLSLARTWSAALYNPAQEDYSSWTHDVGFASAPMEEELKINPSNETARTALLANAQVLAERYSSAVGCTRSWDRGAGDFEVIIDNMMNLQLLIQAAGLSGNSTYTDMAVSHAKKTAQNHVRADGSSFHVVDYSPSTGKVQWQGTAQGLSNSSTWSRGQAWGILGFALMANATGNTEFLDVSRRMATFFLDGLPDAGVSYWDFKATAPTTLDTSASTIAASALLVLSSLETSLGNTTAAASWSNSAITLLNNVVEQGVNSWSGASIVGNGTVNNRADPPNNNTGIVYGDAHFLLSGNHLLQLGLANCTNGQPAVGASPSALSSTLFSSSGSSGNSSSSAGSSSDGDAGTSSGGGGNAGARGAGTPVGLFRALGRVARALRR
ncbi:hypothetical protein JCM10207_001159 [Rhodosporidiobolus poonsookiae]